MASKHPETSDVSDQETENERQVKGRLALVLMRTKALLDLYDLLKGQEFTNTIPLL